MYDGYKYIHITAKKRGFLHQTNCLCIVLVNISKYKRAIWKGFEFFLDLENKLVHLTLIV